MINYVFFSTHRLHARSEPTGLWWGESHAIWWTGAPSGGILHSGLFRPASGDSLLIDGSEYLLVPNYIVV